MDERFLEIDGRRLRYLVGGEGPPLVLCHGFMGSAENFDSWLAELTTRRTVVIPDLPGCGASSPLDGRHDAEALAVAVCQLLDQLGLGEYDLGGLCLGAAVACAILRRRPHAVQRLVLHTPLLGPELVRRRFRLQVAAMTAPGVYPAVVWLSRRRVVSDLYKRLLVEGSDVDAGAAEVNFRNQQRCHTRATREWLRDGVSREDGPVISTRAKPTLVLVAAGDRIVDVERLRQLCARFPQVELAVVADAGHGWNEAFVRRQLAIIGAFLDGAPLPAPAVAGAAA
jgi:pimeloyl-ACP methyl ester carboxylesterase